MYKCILLSTWNVYISFTSACQNTHTHNIDHALLLFPLFIWSVKGSLLPMDSWEHCHEVEESLDPLLAFARSVSLQHCLFAGNAAHAFTNKLKIHLARQ
ncbi:hypothetical protein BDQ17DRAFT_1345390 [Cyathus striatus]|nr:hypothetical protein BDQ17DRAFT_1345390 [Cyathus striatus]